MRSSLFLQKTNEWSKWKSLTRNYFWNFGTYKGAFLISHFLVLLRQRAIFWGMVFLCSVGLTNDISWGGSEMWEVYFRLILCCFTFFDVHYWHVKAIFESSRPWLGIFNSSKPLPHCSITHPAKLLYIFIFQCLYMIFICHLFLGLELMANLITKFEAILITVRILIFNR